MNKIFNINLGGYPFTIDEDAYLHLKKYLSAIHRHFRSSEGYMEITSDIESRLAELFRERTSIGAIVSLATVQEAVTIMGTPEDFGADPLTAEEETTFSYEKTAPKNDYRTGKRLFRNEDEKIIGGVCSGLTAYLGMKDPVWLRIIFAVFFLTGGLALPLYLILWAVVPAAKTSADRLAMRGEPITVENIGKTIEEELRNVVDKATEIGEELSEKFSGSNGKKNF